MPLLAVAVIANMSLFMVSTANASFQGEQTPVRDYLAPGQILGPMAQATVNTIGENLAFVLSTGTQAAEQPVMAFLGIGDQQQQLPYQNVAQAPQRTTATSAVLGAYTSNAPNTQ